MSNSDKKTQSAQCSFCECKEEEAELLFSGPVGGIGAYICSKCVIACYHILSADK